MSNYTRSAFDTYEDHGLEVEASHSRLEADLELLERSLAQLRSNLSKARLANRSRVTLMDDLRRATAQAQRHLTAPQQIRMEE